MAATCNDLTDLVEVSPSTPTGCRECLAEGTDWVELRLCMDCGHVGCCDSSDGQHATAHHTMLGHPVVQSYEPDGAWAYCYDHDATLEAAPPQVLRSHADAATGED